MHGQERLEHERQPRNSTIRVFQLFQWVPVQKCLACVGGGAFCKESAITTSLHLSSFVRGWGLQVSVGIDERLFSIPLMSRMNPNYTWHLSQLKHTCKNLTPSDTFVRALHPGPLGPESSEQAESTALDYHHFKTRSQYFPFFSLPVGTSRTIRRTTSAFACRV